MSRRHRRRRRPPAGEAPASDGARQVGWQQVEQHPDGEWVVREVTGAASSKTYRCPGCDQEIRPATPHVVAWPVSALGERRHWHRACWRARDRRRPSR